MSFSVQFSAAVPRLPHSHLQDEETESYKREENYPRSHRSSLATRDRTKSTGPPPDSELRLNSEFGGSSFYRVPHLHRGKMPAIAT